jgi:hypothetical protein
MAPKYNLNSRVQQTFYSYGLFANLAADDCGSSCSLHHGGSLVRLLEDQHSGRKTERAETSGGRWGTDQLEQ